MNLRKFYLYIFVDDIKVIIKKRINLNYVRSISLKFYKQINLEKVFLFIRIIYIYIYIRNNKNINKLKFIKQI